MKKLMIAFAMAAMAVASQAAAMKWSSGTLGLPDDGTKKPSNTYSSKAMLVSLSAADYGALETAVAGKSANEISTYLYNTYKGATATKTANFMSGAAALQDTASYGVGDTAYGVVIYTTLDSTKAGDTYYIANMGKYTFAADAAANQGNMGLKLNGTGAAMSWQVASVPEPTSAMLLLLGMAGLALRRRRA